MGWVTVALKPGISTELTPAALESGYTASSCIRFKAGMAQKIGGWTRYCPTSLQGNPRHSHSWEDLENNSRLAVGTTSRVYDFTNGTLTDISPQVLVTNPAVNFTTTAGSPVVTVTDTAVNTITPYDAVFFNTPVSVDGIILSGLYVVTAYISATAYTITAASNGLAGVSGGGAVPNFTTTSGSPSVKVTFPNHGQSAGNDIVFPIATTVGGVTISGRYIIQSIVDANNFTITAAVAAISGAGPTAMNGGNAQFSYSITLGPVAVGGGYDTGLYGAGGYGTGVAAVAQTGSPLPSTDSTLDNWGELSVYCPDGGGIYYWGPASGYANLSIIPTAPPFNTGAFVSIAEQMIIAYGSTQSSSIGEYQDPLLIRWCNVGDFTDWTTLATNQAGQYRIPKGSKIVGGVAGSATTNYIWTDIALWSMAYIGSQFVWDIAIIAENCGLIAKHAYAQLSGNVYWMGPANFFQMVGGSVTAIPCSIWDAVFQNLDFTQKALCHAGANTSFTEVLFFYPSNAGLGYCDTCAKYNIAEGTWDLTQDGTFAQRNTWIDLSILPNPIATTNSGTIYAHESGQDADINPISSWFLTGLFSLNNGEDVPFIDRIYPDLKWGEFGGSQAATLQITVYLYKYPSPNTSPKVYGPFTVTEALSFISKRMRGGHYVQLKVQSTDMGSFWRWGATKVRWAPDGRGI
jgi:hypothetical protein